MREAVGVPVTVKCRIGIDDRDDYGFLHTFVSAVVAAGCATVIVNGGLRTVPQVTEQLAQVDGVMLRREAYHNPYLLPALHRAVHADGFETPEVLETLRQIGVGYAQGFLCGRPAPMSGFPHRK